MLFKAGAVARWLQEWTAGLDKAVEASQTVKELTHPSREPQEPLRVYVEPHLVREAHEPKRVIIEVAK